SPTRGGGPPVVVLGPSQPATAATTCPPAPVARELNCPWFESPCRAATGFGFPAVTSQICTSPRSAPSTRRSPTHAPAPTVRLLASEMVAIRCSVEVEKRLTLDFETVEANERPSGETARSGAVSRVCARNPA